MIDFHSHILPGIDDGARDTKTSLEMLKICSATGIDTIVATPHCHPVSQEKIYGFLEKREKSAEQLRSAIYASGEKYPEIVLASEIRIYDGLSKYKDLDKLTIGDTDYILLEMPYEKWKYDTFDEIYNITKLGLKPIMAHLDRFLDQEHLFCELYSLDLLYQINSCAFIDKNTRRMMARLFEKNAIHIIGSDTHNLSDRKPDAATAYEIIGKKFGKEYVNFLEENGRCILKNQSIKYYEMPKLSPIKKLML